MNGVYSRQPKSFSSIVLFLADGVYSKIFPFDHLQEEQRGGQLRAWVGATQVLPYQIGQSVSILQEETITWT